MLGLGKLKTQGRSWTHHPNTTKLVKGPETHSLAQESRPGSTNLVPLGELTFTLVWYLERISANDLHEYVIKSDQMDLLNIESKLGLLLPNWELLGCTCQSVNTIGVPHKIRLRYRGGIKTLSWFLLNVVSSQVILSLASMLISSDLDFFSNLLGWNTDFHYY